MRFEFPYQAKEHKAHHDLHSKVAGLDVTIFMLYILLAVINLKNSLENENVIWKVLEIVFILGAIGARYGHTQDLMTKEAPMHRPNTGVLFFDHSHWAETVAPTDAENYFVVAQEIEAMPTTPLTTNEDEIHGTRLTLDTILTSTAATKELARDGNVAYLAKNAFISPFRGVQATLWACKAAYEYCQTKNKPSYLSR